MHLKDPIDKKILIFVFLSDSLTSLFLLTLIDNKMLNSKY